MAYETIWSNAYFRVDKATGSFDLFVYYAKQTAGPWIARCFSESVYKAKYNSDPRTFALAKVKERLDGITEHSRKLNEQLYALCGERRELLEHYKLSKQAGD